MSGEALTYFTSTTGRLAGPAAILLCEDAFLVSETIAHLAASGFAEIIAAGPEAVLSPLREDGGEDPQGGRMIGRARLRLLSHPAGGPDADAALVNAAIAGSPGIWMHVCRNGEFLHFPFGSNRSIADLVSFVSDERRASVMTYIVDLYSDALDVEAGDPFDLDECWFDALGYYGFIREADQIEIRGGLAWRYEEHVPENLALCARAAIFRARPGLTVRRDLQFDDPVYNTVSCPWHRNPTAALMSVRRARRIRQDSMAWARIGSFRWEKSVRYERSSRQLLELGIIEQGQWF